MEIIAHRGYWKNNLEKNRIVALKRSFLMGMGTETDIRDFNGNLKISHDIANEECPDAEDFFEIYKKSPYTLAINIKADGLQPLLKDKLDRFEIENYFCFDMSVPDMFGYIDANLKYFVRESEFEQINGLYEKADGVWIDGFLDDSWITKDKISAHLDRGKRVCIVSPELHRREYEKQWHQYKCREFLENNKIILCTDYPEKARDFFYGKN